jgi:preprotein translocase subunit SecF
MDPSVNATLSRTMLLSIVTLAALAPLPGQNARGSFAAMLGLLVGGFLLSQLRTEEPVAVVVSIAIPQGLSAALVGW